MNIKLNKITKSNIKTNNSYNNKQKGDCELTFPLKRKATQNLDELPKKRQKTEENPLWDNFDIFDSEMYLGDLYNEIENGEFSGHNNWLQWSEPIIDFKPQQSIAPMIIETSKQENLDSTDPKSFPQQRTKVVTKRAVRTPKKTSIANDALSLISSCFSNNQFAEAEKIARKELEAYPSNYIVSQVKEKKEMKIKLLFALAKACLMQAEDSSIKNIKIAESEAALEDALTLKGSKYSSRSDELCNFYLNLSKDCFAQTKYLLTEVIAFQGTIINHNDYVRAELFLILTKAYLSQGKNDKAKISAKEGLGIEFITKELATELKILLSKA